MGMGQNPIPLVNIKIAGKWMFIPLKNGMYRYWSIAIYIYGYIWTIYPIAMSKSSDFWSQDRARRPVPPGGPPRGYPWHSEGRRPSPRASDSAAAAGHSPGLWTWTHAEVGKSWVKSWGMGISKGKIMHAPLFFSWILPSSRCKSNRLASFGADF